MYFSPLDSNIEMKSADLFYSSMRKVMLALIGESPSASPSPSPETLHPFDAWSARTPASDRMDPGQRGSLDQGHRGSPEVMFDENFARKTNTRITPPQLDRARWVVGSFSITVTYCQVCHWTVLHIVKSMLFLNQLNMSKLTLFLSMLFPY